MSQNLWEGWQSQAKVVKVQRAVLTRTLTTTEVLRVLVTSTSKVNARIMRLRVLATVSGLTMLVGRVGTTKLSN